MAVFKCKMCGGTLEIQGNETTVTCEYCDSKQTLPKLTDDRVERLYDRANHFRRNNEFDKAMGIYEQILAEDESDAEVYWSLVLCSYGIEYVEDPVSHRRVPTVNRTQFTSIFDDENYKRALQHADISQKVIYEEEAKQINEIQKGILAISQNEEPFDVFICYKESDENGRRTRDSAIYANDLYHELTKEGFKVFYSRITLEDKLGQAYEPYIFAALNSAKVMVVIGTKPEYFNAVWVKNEWSRFLGMMKKGQKKTLIPAYSGMDPYDLPEEFSHLQAQDMQKLGFMPDLIRGIKKIIGVEQKVVAAPVAQQTSGDNANSVVGIDSLLKRIEIFLENSDWKSASSYCEKVLDRDPENSKAYVYKLLSQAGVATVDGLAKSKQALEDYPAYRNAIRYADPRIADEIQTHNAKIKEKLKKEEEKRNEQNKRQQHIDHLKSEKKGATQKINQLRSAAENVQHKINYLNIAGKRRFETFNLILAIAILASGFLMLLIGGATGFSDESMSTIIIFGISYMYICPMWLAARLDKSRLGALIANSFTYGIWYVVVSFKVILTYKKSMNVIVNEYNELVAQYNKIGMEMQQMQSYLDETTQQLNQVYK